MASLSGGKAITGEGGWGFLFRVSVLVGLINSRPYFLYRRHLQLYCNGSLVYRLRRIGL